MFAGCTKRRLLEKCSVLQAYQPRQYSIETLITLDLHGMVIGEPTTAGIESLCNALPINVQATGTLVAQGGVPTVSIPRLSRLCRREASRQAGVKQLLPPTIFCSGIFSILSYKTSRTTWPCTIAAADGCHTSLAQRDYQWVLAREHHKMHPGCCPKGQPRPAG